MLIHTHTYTWVKIRDQILYSATLTSATGWGVFIAEGNDISISSHLHLPHPRVLEATGDWMIWEAGYRAAAGMLDVISQ